MNRERQQVGIMDAECANPFAVTLLFYDRFRRAKLWVPEFYKKMLKKYEKKPSGILPDLKSKYAECYEIPNGVSLRYLQRLFSVYNVPVDYKSVILKDINEHLLNGNKTDFGDAYNEDYDVCSENYNAERAFPSNPPYLTRAEGVKTPLYDNIAKAKHLVHKDVKEFVVPDRSFVDSMKEKQKALEARQRSSRPHLFEEIVDKVINPSTWQGGKGAGAGSSCSSSGKGDVAEDGASPYRVIQNLIHKKLRASILVRRKSGIKGILTCYIKAMDRHMNMLLADVDEVSAARGKKAKINVLRKEVFFREDENQSKLMRMHFDQVLLRGDCVVLVSKA